MMDCQDCGKRTATHIVFASAVHKKHFAVCGNCVSDEEGDIIVPTELIKGVTE